MNEKPLNKKDGRFLTILIPKGDQEKIRAIAKSHGLPVTGIVRLALRAGMPSVENQLRGI